MRDYYKILEIVAEIDRQISRGFVVINNKKIDHFALAIWELLHA